MPTTIDLRELINGEWLPLDLKETANMSLAEIAMKYKGRDVVFKYDNGKGIKGYFCGTEERRLEREKAGHRVFTFEQLAERPHPGVHAQIPLLDEVARTFGDGAGLTQVTLC